MKSLFTILFISVSMLVFSQKTLEKGPLKNQLIDLGPVVENDENYSNYDQLKETLKDVEIVMLGEQSHGDGTTYKTKVKLIKYLYEEMGFDILAFESGVYDCTRAWDKIEQGEDVATALANSVFFLWSTTKEFKPLAAYIDENKNAKNPLVVTGFDSQFTGRISEKEFTSDLKEYIEKINPEIIQSQEWSDFETSLNFVLNYEIKEYEEEQAQADTSFINTMISALNRKDAEADYWTQVLNNTKSTISDLMFKTDFRDKQMAANLIWLKENNPGKKIICWGATSHFLYNSSEIRMKSFPYNIVDNYYQKQPMMGQYIKDKYGDKVFTIGFIAYEGRFGLTSDKKIKPAKENSLEYAIEKSGYQNCFLSFEDYDSGNLISRPLAQKYMKNNISQVMDGVIFNKNMKRPRLDRNFFLEIYPENKWIKPEPTENASAETDK